MGERLLRPLEGKRVVITRAVEQARELAEALKSAGAEPIVLPVLRIAPLENYEALDAALKSGGFDWVLFTSQNAVSATRQRVERLRIAEPWEQSRVGVVGEATAKEARRAGFRVTHIASRATGKALVRDLAGELRGRSVFLPRSDRGDPELQQALEGCGAKVTAAVAYRTVINDALSTDERSKVAESDAVLFFSPSAVAGFFRMFGADARKWFEESAVAAAVGPVTQASLNAAGVGRVIAAEEASVAGIVEALADFFQQGVRSA